MIFKGLFNRDKDNDLLTHLSKLENVIKNMDFVECETCGCLLRKQTARVVEEIDIRLVLLWAKSEDYTKYIYYCKRCYLKQRGDEMKNTTLKKGTIIKRNGVPFKLNQDTVVSTHKNNEKLSREKLNCAENDRGQ